MIQTDIVIIGSGIGGLSCAALLAYYGFDVIVCESHSIPGGAAHSFEYNGFSFDSGPSLHSGLSAPSANPLRQLRPYGDCYVVGILPSLGLAYRRWLPVEQ
jgi:phytoene dehydrogenase-like protein